MSRSGTAGGKVGGKVEGPSVLSEIIINLLAVCYSNEPCGWGETIHVVRFVGEVVKGRLKSRLPLRSLRRRTRMDRVEK